MTSSDGSPTPRPSTRRSTPTKRARRGPVRSVPRSDRQRAAHAAAAAGLGGRGRCGGRRRRRGARGAPPAGRRRGVGRRRSGDDRRHHDHGGPHDDRRPHDHHCAGDPPGAAARTRVERQRRGCGAATPDRPALLRPGRSTASSATSPGWRCGRSRSWCSACPATSATGVVTNEMWQRMQDPIAIEPLRHYSEGQATENHTEVYLPQQVVAFFVDDQPVLVSHMSSGTGEEWCEVVTIDPGEFGNEHGTERRSSGARSACSDTPGGVYQLRPLRRGPARERPRRDVEPGLLQLRDRHPRRPSTCRCTRRRTAASACRWRWARCSTSYVAQGRPGVRVRRRAGAGGNDGQPAADLQPRRPRLGPAADRRHAPPDHHDAGVAAGSGDVAWTRSIWSPRSRSGCGDGPWVGESGPAGGTPGRLALEVARGDRRGARSSRFVSETTCPAARFVGRA